MERHSLQIILFLFFILVIGCGGYLIIEDDWSVFDAIYMTIITITTVGYGETKELTNYGRLFTIFLIILGFGAMAMFTTQFARFIIESEIKGLFVGRKIMRKLKKMKNHFIVCGFGRIGSSICSELTKKGLDFVVIEINEKLVQEAEKKNYCAIKGNATADSSLKEAAIDRCAGLVAALSADADNLFISLSARELNPKILIVSRGEEPGVEDRILRAGADIVVSPITLGGQQIAHLLSQTNVASSYDLTKEEQNSLLGFALRIYRSSKEEVCTVAEIKEESNALNIIAIKHEDGSIETNFSNDMEISPHDSVVIVKHNEVKQQKTITKEKDNKKILIADDHKALRLLFTRKISAGGHDVITAEDGDEAVVQAMKHKPDLIILDVMMPNRNGYEACITMKATPELNNIPIILYSADESQEFITKGKNAGADACIRKTSKSSDLLSKIDEFLYKPKQRIEELEKEEEEESEKIIFDPTELFELVEGDVDLIKDTIEIFMNEIPGQLSKIKESLSNENIQLIKEEAHSIKGAAASTGCIEIQELAFDIEQAAKNNKLDQCKNMTESLEKAFERMQNTFKDYDWNDLTLK